LEISIKIFTSPYVLAEKFAEEMVTMVNVSAKLNQPFTIALSGGSTPALLFSILGDHFSKSAPWEYAHFFWGDERCVPSDDPESNYGITKKAFLDKIDIPMKNIHRIFGENDPSTEAKRYSGEIAGFTRKSEGIPVFDLIILGLGEDGHTASIFPGDVRLLNSGNICETAKHPVSSQKRVSLTGRVINNADMVVFLVTGTRKAAVVSSVIERPGSSDYPAAHIKPQYGILKWYLDEPAAEMLQNKS
jgi:6-phosphogluconolactonase